MYPRLRKPLYRVSRFGAQTVAKDRGAYESRLSPDSACDSYNPVSIRHKARETIHYLITHTAYLRAVLIYIGRHFRHDLFGGAFHKSETLFSRKAYRRSLHPAVKRRP